MYHMRPAIQHQSAGPDVKRTANQDEPRQTVEGADHDGVSIDDSSPGYNVKIESPDSSASLAQYDGTIGFSLTPSEPNITGVDRPNTIASRYTPGSSLPYRSSATTKHEEEYASQDEIYSPNPLALAVRPVEPVQHSKTPTRHQLQPEIWELYKEEIHELYIEENKPLNELMDIMQAKGFKATPRMYKAKFAQWGFVKNNKKRDVAMMLRLQRERGAVGKPTTFRRHGRSVDIETYMKRKGISSLELVTPAADVDVDVDLPEYLRALTPPPVEPQHMTLPSHLHAQEILVSCFKDLTLSWSDSLESPVSFEKDFNLYFDGELCEATRDFSRACWFFSRNHNPLGAVLSQRAFSSLHLLIKTPSALGLFDLLIASVISPDYGLAKELWRYLAGYAEAVLGTSSTFYRLFTAIYDVFRNDSLETGVDFIFSCMESILDMLLETNDFSQTVVPAISLFLLGDLILFNSKRTNLPSLQRVVASSSTIFDSHGRSHSPDLMLLLEPTAYVWQKGPLDARSVKLAGVALRLDISDRYDWTSWVSWRVIAQYHRSRCGTDSSAVKDHPRHALARYALERAIDAAEAGRGFGDTQIFENMQLLESWHREAGDTVQEAMVRRRREKSLKDYLESLLRSRLVEMPNTPTSQ
ncbi:uncharacterized protein F4812DRAFT_399375 [Daldinia caldariorum]|uniref:uncharacterized protein n=1 Tax=Daldinia caldariorum TaxID=326644 RepID=UPI002007C7E4|nr:uncharacterized protein F4812DRAFT_399375 [Daldinia caldariorum]KAI1467498.1 hypothetical protein F4812DRAFT_399375 [Daldinia caldariorum]